MIYDNRALPFRGYFLYIVPIHARIMLCENCGVRCWHYNENKSGSENESSAMHTE